MRLLLLKELPRFECLLQAATRYPDLDPASTSAFLHLLHTGDLVFAAESRALATFSLSQGRFSILMLLNRHREEPQTPAQLADQSGVTRATITGLLDTLEKDALVERSPDPEDRRLTLVRLTPKGASLMDSVIPPYFQHVASLLSSLSSEECHLLVDLLQKIQQGLTQPLSSSRGRPPHPKNHPKRSLASLFMWKRMLLMLLCAALAITGLAYAKFRQIQAGIALGKSFAPPPAAVTTLTVHPQSWTPNLSAIGTVRAVQGVTVSTDVAGIVAEIRFESGQTVHKGELLVRLQNESETAQLHSAQARLRLAQLERTRKRELQSKNALASSELDIAESELQSAQAAVEQANALLTHKQIAAPFDGVLGIRQVSVGQFLNPGSSIASMHSIDPVRIQFPLPQAQMSAATPPKIVHVHAAGIGPGVWTGTITALDSQLNPASRSILVEATVSNPDHTLREGMFVKVQIPLPEEPGAFVVPASAIHYAPYGDSVYVVKDSTDADGKPIKTVTQQTVKLGEARGDQVRILSGLNDGDEVVTSGTFKLRPEAPVQVKNSITPPSEAEPNPPNT